MLGCWNRLVESSMQPLFINPMMLLIDRWPEVQYARKEKVAEAESQSSRCEKQLQRFLDREWQC